MPLWIGRSKGAAWGIALHYRLAKAAQHGVDLKEKSDGPLDER